MAYQGDYVEVNDSIIGRKVLYDNREKGKVVKKVTEATSRRGAEYLVRLESGADVYITDNSLWKFKILRQAE